MHYNVDYNGLTPQAKHNKAIEDIKEYMGDIRYNLMSGTFIETYPCGMSLEQFELIASFAGVQGYPVRAWYNEIYPFG